MVDTQLTLRPFRPEDASVITDILTDRNVAGTYMLPDFSGKEDALPLFHRLSELSEREDRYVRCICLQDSPIGFLNDVEIRDSTMELGYVIHPAHQGRGYMTSALNAAIRELTALGFRELRAGAFCENRASLRVMEKCGMIPTGESEMIHYRGAEHKCVYYRRILDGRMTNSRILQIALTQSAIDCNCYPADFLKEEHTVVRSRPHPSARKYLPLPFSCDLVSYGNGIVAQTSPELTEPVREYIHTYPAAHAFETPNLHVLDDLLRPHGMKVCFMAEYFLPDVDILKPLECPYELRILHQADFQELYLPQWSNALCEKRKTLDVLGVGAYDGDTLVGLAGCSADCEDMYQIGVDVLPEYRRQGIAAAVTSRLALEVLRLGKVPFYCAAWCNLKSVRNAIKCGFRPAWVEVTARETAFVNKINEK